MKFTIENFKIFKEDTEFDLRPITLFIGPNGSGKSSAIKAIETIKKLNIDRKHISVPFTESKFSIFNELKNKERKDDPITISFLSDAYKISLIYEDQEENKSLGELKAVEILSTEEEIVIIENNGDNLWYVNLDFFYSSSRPNEWTKSFRNPNIKLPKTKNEIVLNWGNNSSKLDSKLEEWKKIVNDEITEGDNVFLESSDFDTKVKEFFLLKSKFVIRQSETKFSFEKIHLTEEIRRTYPTFCQGFEEGYFTIDSTHFSGIAELIGKNVIDKFVKFIDENLEAFDTFNWVTTNRQFLNNIKILPNAKSDRRHNIESEIDKLANIFLNLDEKEKNLVHNEFSKLANKLDLFKGFSISLFSKDSDLILIEVNRLGKDYKISDLSYGLVNLFSIILYLSLGNLNIRNSSFDFSKKKFLTIRLEYSIEDYSPFLNLPTFNTVNYAESYKPYDLSGEKEKNTMLEIEKGEYLDIDLENSHKTYYLIEEPEMNLHPDAQCNLADVFVQSVVDNNNVFVIETHSEYFLRKLQVLVKSKKISHKDIQIYYFNAPEILRSGDPIVIPMNLREDGTLTKPFGKGFYDVAINSLIALLDIDNKN